MEIEERESLRHLCGRPIFLVKQTLKALGGPTPYIPADIYSISFGGSRYDKKFSFVFLENFEKSWIMSMDSFITYLTDTKSIHLLDKELGTPTTMQEQGFFKAPAGKWPPRAIKRRAK
jgi:hypothetical protein